MAIHHATLKRAAKLGVEIQEIEGQYNLRRLEDGFISEDAWDSAKEALDALADETDPVEFADPNEADDEEQDDGRLRSGVMPIEYHKLYTANGGGCGDTVDHEMRDAFLTPEGVDTKALRLWGELCGLWNPAWEVRNPGMQRMNLANRVRGWLRTNEAGSLPCPDGSDGVTRFGVAFQPRAPRKSRRKPAKAAAPQEGAAA